MLFKIFILINAEVLLEADLSWLLKLVGFSDGCCVSISPQTQVKKSPSILNNLIVKFLPRGKARTTELNRSPVCSSWIIPGV